VTFLHLLPLLLSVAGAAFRRPIPATFNVLSYGASHNRFRDNTKAFLGAWNDACERKGGGRVYVPYGTYMLDSVVFSGPCNGPVDFIIKGTLEATSNPSKFFSDHWIVFKYVDRLRVAGGGYLLGHGDAAWRYNDCAHNSWCRSLPILSTDSPNTDGIHIGSSTKINIRDSIISTGDDCVAIIAGSRDISVTRVHCGPGHGFSIGSLGKSHNKEIVSGIVIQNSTLHRTQNGLRIKTWAPSLPSLASDIMFDDITMVDVNNPIFIDQQYCPRPPCNAKAQSNVQIKNVTFRKVRGTSSSKVAVKLQCSKHVPCEGVKLVNINLVYRGPEGRVESSCLNVQGKSYGLQLPSGCL
ncbi:hypothetical protein M8C21_016249, partial [Ambrosia artemisiifolia]